MSNRLCDTVEVNFRIGRWAYQKLEQEAAARGKSVTEHICSIVHAFYQQRVRTEALQKIESTVKAADSATGAVEALLLALKQINPSELPAVDADYFGKKQRRGTLTHDFDRRGTI
jgi:hypothetical protein